MGILPKIKATISSFLLGEEGKISKQSGLLLGSFLLGASITALLEPQVGISDGGCGCGCACACACGVVTPVVTAVHSSSSAIDFEQGMEKASHYSHSSV